jgi:hypothetical protein
MVNIALAHASDEAFPDAQSFTPERFLHRTPDTYTWICVRRWGVPPPRRGFRQYGNGRDAADSIARVRVCHDQCARRSVPLPRSYERPCQRRPRRRVLTSTVDPCCPRATASHIAHYHVMAEGERHGWEHVMQRAMSPPTAPTLFISLNIDVLNPAWPPGPGTRSPTI